MKVVRVHNFGGPEVLSYEEVPDPVPAATELLVKVAAAGVNFIDIYQRSGLYPGPLPRVLGSEGAGEVVACGEAVTGFRPGERVAYAGVSGAYAELHAVPAAKAVLVPAEIAEETAAAIMLQGLTAHYLARSTFPASSGHFCLVHAGAGGVGQLLIQLLKSAGAIVITTVSSAAKAELARARGADEVVDYTQTNFVDAVARVSNGRGADVVYDSVGRDTFEESLKALAPRGMLVSFGQSSGPVGPIDPLQLGERSLYLTRPRLDHYIARRDELEGRAADLFQQLTAGTLKVEISRTLPLAEAAVAHAALAARETTGKVLLLP